ncbi:MAG: hypothetical protein DU489_06990 [Nitrosomonas sp.]|uniref:hypothetical protein n=1 Tax=Nitrosomonas sp. TaxID=42353 RepID=UPI0032EBE200
MEYSFKKGLSKGAMSILVVTVSLVTFAGFHDVTIWGLLEQHLKPLLGSVTVGGALTMALNYIKIKNMSN